MARPERFEIYLFPSELGWMALVASDVSVRQLTFGHPSAAAASAAIDPALSAQAVVGDDWQWLVERLQCFAAGERVEFDDVAIETAHLGPFERRVVDACRAIPYGQTRSYGALAALAGSPRAARAVGNTMAGNRVALIMPCHRVINSDGGVGNYGAAEGRPSKLRLLAMEKRAADLVASDA